MNALTRLLIDTVPASNGTGFVGADVPVDLLLATGRPFGHLPWDDQRTPWADRWLESGFPFWTRTILEDWHAGRFDDLAQVVFSRAEDASQRLYYYVRELQSRGLLRGPAPLVFDCAFIQRDSSLAHTAAAVRDVAGSLGVSAADLSRGIERGNALRRKLAAIQAGRKGNGPFYEELARAALFTDPSGWLDGLQFPAAVAAGARVLLAGSVPPDDRLHRAVEAGGASVVSELHVHSLMRHGAAVAAGGDAAVELARHVVASSIGPRSFGDRARAIIEAARAAEVQAVVLWLTREEEALAWHVPAQRRALEGADIPALVLTSRDWRAADGAVQAIETFVRETLA